MSKTNKKTLQLTTNLPSSKPSCPIKTIYVSYNCSQNKKLHKLLIKNMYSISDCLLYTQIYPTDLIFDRKT